MKRMLLIAQAGIVAGLLAFAANASAALTYFDAQILDIQSGKTIIPKNTTWANGTLFTATPEDPAVPTTGNWSRDNSVGNHGPDGRWRQRNAANFGNPDGSGTGTVYESRGQNAGAPNQSTENAAALKTTINVPAADQGQNKSVWVMFWSDGSPWQISASLTNPDDDTAPQYVGGGSQTPSGYVQEVFDAGEPFGANLAAGYPQLPGTSATALLMDSTANYTSSDAGAVAAPTGRHLWAGFLGDLVLGATLDVYVGDGRPLNATQLANANGSNHRTWYDGIAIGNPTGLARLPDLPPVPEPAGIALLCLGLIGCGLSVRRRVG